ncbi:MAG: hemolysin family protein [Pseudonocardia sp.]
MTESVALALSVFLLAGNAFFVGAEFAIITARRDRLQTLAEGGNAGARSALQAGEHLPLLIAGAQLGITLCSLGLGRLGEPTVAHLIEGPFEWLGMPEGLLHPIAFTLALGVVVTLHTVVGEMVPKNLAIAGPERVAVILVPAHYAFCKAVRPLLSLFTLAATAVLRLVHVIPRDELESAYTGSELAEMISDSRREGLLDEQESGRLTQTLGAGERSVQDVMVPLERVVSLPLTATVGEVAAAVTEVGVSRLPLCAPDGRMVGYLHVKDVLEVADDPTAVLPADRARALPQLPSDARLDDALAAMRRSQAHLALVVAGEPAAPIGLIAMDDLVQYFVGAAYSNTAPEPT